MQVALTNNITERLRFSLRQKVKNNEHKILFHTTYRHECTVQVLVRSGLHLSTTLLQLRKQKLVALFLKYVLGNSFPAISIS